MISNLINKYINELNLIRENPKLLDNYCFDKDALNSKHFERLRLNIAIYNDFKKSDFEIAKFLFMQEKEWRKYGKDGEVDNLYFSAFVLTLFQLPQIIWLFFEAKDIDFDSRIGFDAEFLFSSGLEKTYLYLESAEHPMKESVLNYIEQNRIFSDYSEVEINEWKNDKTSYFKVYKFPTENELDFLFSTNERELFLAELPNWIVKKKNWTNQDLDLYITYAKYSGNKDLQIESLKLTIDKSNDNFLVEIYKTRLAQLYLDTCQNNKTFEILESVIKQTKNKNIIRDCVEQLCNLILNSKILTNDISKQSYKLIITQQKKYKNFSPVVDKLINDVLEIYKIENDKKW